MSIAERRRGPKKRLVNPVKVSTQLEKSYLDLLAVYCEEHHIPLTEGFARAIEKLVQPEGGRGAERGRQSGFQFHAGSIKGT